MANRLTTTTNTYLLPKVVDTILNSNVFATRMLSGAQKWKGQKIEKAVKASKNSNGKSFSGLDTFSTAEVDTRIKLSFDPKFYEQPVVVELTELSTNSSDPNRVVDLAALELESAAEDMADSIGTLFYSDGEGNSSKDFQGLEAIVDDGTNTPTYGGQARATYTTLKSTVTAASSNKLSLAQMATLYNAISSGSVKPTLGLTTEAVFSLYEQLLNPQEKIVKDVPMMKAGLIGGSGFTGLYYKGFPILADEKCTSAVLYFVNEDFLEFRALPMAKTQPVNYGIEIEGNDYTNVRGLGFSWSGWIIPSNQAALIGHIYLGGELWSSNPKRHGKLTGVTTT